MRTKNVHTAQIIIECIDDYFDKNHRTPSLRELEDQTGISRQTVQRYLKDMSLKGEIMYDGKTTVTKHIEHLLSKKICKLPLIGCIACGIPDSHEQSTEDYIDFPVSLLGSGNYFVLRASGNSMTNAGIDDGDFVIVRAQHIAKIGQIVVAIDDENCNTLKRLLYDGKRYYLHAENEAFSDLYPDELRIQGVAIRVIKQLY